MTSGQHVGENCATLLCRACSHGILKVYNKRKFAYNKYLEECIYKLQISISNKRSKEFCKAQYSMLTDNLHVPHHNDVKP